MGWRLGKMMQVRLATVDARSVDLLRMVLDQDAGDAPAAVKLANLR
jgi:hypothetical protein